MILQHRSHQVLIAAGLLAAAAPAPAAHACGSLEEMINRLFAQTASDDAAASARAIDRMRSLGPRAVDSLCAKHDAIVAANPLEMTVNPSDELIRLRQVIDAVARQRDAHASRLFWHTDWSTAVAAAQASNKPILSLRLLGNLDEDRSCANSRFFRTVLYANADVSTQLRENFILHWESLRPVPKLTIDFCDGRRIERTITGNSIHYVMDARGNLIDAIPGLYGPAAFVRALEHAGAVARESAACATDASRARLLGAYHASAISRITQEWAGDMQQINVPSGLAAGATANPGTLKAVQAAPIAMTKSGVELPAINLLAGEAPAIVPPFADVNDGQVWAKLASLHWDDAALDARSVALMRAKLGPQEAAKAMKLAMSKRLVEDPFMRTVANFQRSIAEDTVRNHYVFHRRIHEWLAATPTGTPVAAFNERVYAELFLTPLDDPWMGLAPADAYAALDHEGLLVTSLKD